MVGTTGGKVNSTSLLCHFYRLHNVKMDGSVEDEAGVEMSGIERCSCPATYAGYSCEASIDRQCLTLLVQLLLAFAK